MDHHPNQNKVTIATLLITLGVIYGDIGTSPLYVMKAIFGHQSISELVVFGSLSCIIWTIFILTTVKYVWITLKADNQGEGGIFSLYSLVRKYGKRLVIPTMIGAATLLADGIITPAISVTSAVEGLKMKPYFADLNVVPYVLIILFFIFLSQRLGTQKVGKGFGPVMVIWFSMLMILGVIHIIDVPQILKAFNPLYAYQMLKAHPEGFWLLGAVFLCTTGAEALYSDLGHCGKKNIRYTWIFVKISLLCNYLGQGAWLLQHNHQHLAGRNPFFELMPEWFLIPGIIIATLSACIASQALITGSFTLINEAMNLNFWLRVSVKQPSESKGQIYIPSVNNILWIGCSLMVIYFQSSAAMESAYGLAITLTMLTTTFLLTYFVRYKLKWHPLAVFAFLSLFFLLELAFFTANIIKFAEGGYILIMIATLFFTIMYITYFGRKINNNYTKFVPFKNYTNVIHELSNDTAIPKFASHLIYLTKANNKNQIEERIIQSIINKKPKRANTYWFVHINRTNNPYTLDYELVEIVEDKIIKVNINVGFRISPKTELYFKKIVSDMVASNELDPAIYIDPNKKYSNEPDFKFIVIEKYLSVENDFKLHEGMVLKSYFELRKLGIKDEKAFGLDKSDVDVEHVPLIYSPVKVTNLQRKTF